MQTVVHLHSFFGYYFLVTKILTGKRLPRTYNGIVVRQDLAACDYNVGFFGFVDYLNKIQ